MDKKLIILTSSEINGRGILTKSALRIAMCIALVILVCLGANNVVKANCPLNGIGDCEEFQPGAGQPGWQQTIAYPPGSDCYVTFEYCFRMTCINEIEAFIDVISYTGDCDEPFKLTTDLYISCLDAVIQQWYSHPLWWESFPPCPDTYIGVSIYTYSCKTAWFPYYFNCDEQPPEYKSVKCDITGAAHCMTYMEYCWDKVNGVDDSIYVLKSTFLYTEMVGNADCPSKNILFIDQLWQSNCFGIVLGNLSRSHIDDFRTGILGNGRCQGLSGKALEDCITECCENDPRIFKNFWVELESLLRTWGGVGCCPLVMQKNLDLLMEHFPNGSIKCHPGCH